MQTGVEGAQLEEAKGINTSLMALGQVTFALAHTQLYHIETQTHAASAELPWG